VAVDDDPTFMEVLGIYLKEYGDFEISTYSSPQEALEYIVSENVDAIISDYTMPEMDGISFFKLVKARIPNIPFLLLTGKSEASLILEAMNVGVDFLQFKGDDPSHLFGDIAQKIKSAVGKHCALKEIEVGIQKREELILILRDLMDGLSAATTQNQASDACLTSIRHIAGCTKGSIHIFNPVKKKMELLIAHNLPEDQLKRFTFGECNNILISGKSQYYPDPEKKENQVIIGGQIPIRRGSEVIGVLSFILDKPMSILQETRDTMEILVSHLGNTIMRIRSEEQVRTRQDELNELYNAMEELVIVVDMDGTILNINPAVIRKLGYQEIELIGSPIYSLYSDKIRDTLIFQFINLTETRGKIQNLYPFISREGKSIPVETRGTVGIWGDRQVLFCISRDISERLEAERNIHEYYERLQAILSSSTAQIYMKDYDLRYLTTNRPFIESLAPPIQSVEGMTDADIFPEPIAAQKKEIDLQIISENVPIYNFEEELKASDGSSKWLVTSKLPVHDLNGNVTGIVGTSLDITDLVKTRKDLLKRDNILSAISSIAYFLVRSEDWESLIPECLNYIGEATEMDVLFFSQVTKSSDRLSGKIFYDWWKVHPDNKIQQQYLIGINSLIDRYVLQLSDFPAVQGSLSEIPVEMSSRFGTISPSSYLLLSIYTSESLWGVIGFMDNSHNPPITQSEVDALITASGIIGSVIESSQTEELFHRPVERSLVGIYLMQDDHLVYVNPRMSDILGYSRETLEMMPYTLCFHQDDIKVAVGNHQRVLETPDATDDYEIRSTTADGRVIYVENLISQFRYQGRPAVIGSIMDITARKNSEISLRQSLHEKDILLREVHHRVKNNMQIIVSMLRMQISTINNPEVIGMLNESKNRILSMAMIHEKLYRTDNLTSVNLLEYLSTLVNTLISDFSADENQITLDLICDPTIEMTIDAGIPLGLIINELLTNTFKHGIKSNQKGKISLHVITADSKWLDISYRDSGKGLPDGFILENCETLGMQLIQNLVFQASGELTMGTDNGIIVTLRIPMSEGFLIGD